MLRSLQSKMLFYFVIISLLSILLMSIAFRLSFDECFSIYLDNKREEEIERVVDKLRENYIKNNMNFYIDLAEPSGIKSLLSYQAMTENIYYQVLGMDGTTILDSSVLMNEMMDVQVNAEDKQAFLYDLGYISDTRPFYVNGEQVASIDSYYKLGYKKGEFQFKERLNKYILGAEGTMIAIGILVSFLFSGKLTSGLKQMRETARQLSHNNLAVRMPIKGLPQEVQQVAASFNELAESLSHQENLRKQFSSDLAHEFRTPIATLRSQIEAFQDGVWEATPDRLNQCHLELMRLVRLVDELEKLMAVENPKLQLNIERISLSDKLELIQKDYIPIFQKKNIRLILGNTVSNEFLADPDRFIQIISNILNNSYKYTCEGGTVSIDGYENDGNIYIKIIDTGIGIPTNDLPHIFERFYRGDKSRTRKTGGIGIGLSIVKALVIAQGGSVTVESKLTEGTAVTVSFPCAH